MRDSWHNWQSLNLFTKHSGHCRMDSAQQRRDGTSGVSTRWMTRCQIRQRFSCQRQWTWLAVDMPHHDTYSVDQSFQWFKFFVSKSGTFLFISDIGCRIHVHTNCPDVHLHKNCADVLVGTVVLCICWIRCGYLQNERRHGEGIFKLQKYLCRFHSLLREWMLWCETWSLSDQQVRPVVVNQGHIVNAVVFVTWLI